MPLHSKYRCITCLDLMPHLARLPVPEAYVTAAITRADKLSVRADSHVRRITSDIVTPIALLSILPEAIGGGIDCDLVVGRLEGNIFA